MSVRTLTDRKESILEAAADLFSRKGFQAASMRELAEHVGIEAASIYSHFSSKDELLRTLAWRCAEDFERTVRPVFESALHTRAKLKAMIAAHINVLARNRKQAMVFIIEWKHLEPAHRQRYEVMRDNYEQMFRDVVRQGVIENLLRNLDEKLCALILLSALNGTANWYRPDGYLTPDELGDQVAETIINGLVRHV